MAQHKKNAGQTYGAVWPADNGARTDTTRCAVNHMPLVVHS
jgi:hypothetical protein